MKCTIKGCPGEYEERKIVHTVRHHGQVIVIDHVPAEVCCPPLPKTMTATKNYFTPKSTFGASFAGYSLRPLLISKTSYQKRG